MNHVSTYQHGRGSHHSRSGRVRPAGRDAAPAIPLNGGQEAGAADPDGHGFFTYTLEGTTFCWTLNWQYIESPTAAHVHVGPRNVAGPVVIPLSVAANQGSGCTTITAELAAGISADPATTTSMCTTRHSRPVPSAVS